MAEADAAGLVQRASLSLSFLCCCAAHGSLVHARFSRGARTGRPFDGVASRSCLTAMAPHEASCPPQQASSPFSLSPSLSLSPPFLRPFILFLILFSHQFLYFASSSSIFNNFLISDPFSKILFLSYSPFFPLSHCLTLSFASSLFLYLFGVFFSSPNPNYLGNPWDLGPQTGLVGLSSSRPF